MDGSFVLKLETNGTIGYLRRIPEGEGGTAFVSCASTIGRVTAAGWWGEQFSVRRFSGGMPLNVEVLERTATPTRSL